MNVHDTAYQAAREAFAGKDAGASAAAAEQAAEPAPTQAELLVQSAAGCLLFTAPEGKTFATIPASAEDGREETLPILGSGFRQWLMRRYYFAFGKPPAARSVQEAQGVLEAQARFDGPRKSVFCRIAPLTLPSPPAPGGEGRARGAKDKIYVDLCDGPGSIVAVSADGWTITDRLGIPFRRPRGMGPLPLPAAQASVNSLRPFVNLANEDDWRLLISWLVFAFRPHGPYPVLCLHGEQGSAKSTTARVLRSLIDPSTPTLRAEPREPRDLVIAATNAWVLAFDNLSHLPEWLSDALCRLSTGGGFATRELYSDAEEVLFEAQRPIILTGIEDLASRGDLLDRSVVLHLPPIADTERKTEAAFWSAFEQARPAILGGLLDAVAFALGQADQIVLDSRPRMADFATWASAAAGALGWRANDFQRAYAANRAMANALGLEASPVVPPLRQFMAGRSEWEDSCTVLLEALTAIAGPVVARSVAWPKNARALSNVLRRLAPNLRKTGLHVEFRRSTTPKGRTVYLRKESAG